MKELIGKKIKKIFMDGEYLKFQTDKGDVLYQVTGDCCSVSYFHDFIGVENLLKNGEVKSVEPIDMSTLEATDRKKCCKKCEESECLSYYGFRITTEDPKFGEVSSVLSFRNDSNGYYGGSLDVANSVPEDLPEIEKDWIND